MAERRAARRRGGMVASRRQEPGALFHPRPGGVAEAVGPSLGARRPLVAGLVIWIAAFVLLGPRSSGSVFC